jgi:hypothetical protein
MDVSSSHWKDFFCKWPDVMPRRGVLVTSFGEQVPFAGFMTSETFLLVERQTPDTLGARMLVFAYEEIAALKIVEVVKPKLFSSLGFEGELPQK